MESEFGVRLHEEVNVRYSESTRTCPGIEPMAVPRQDRATFLMVRTGPTVYRQWGDAGWAAQGRRAACHEPDGRRTTGGGLHNKLQRTEIRWRSGKVAIHGAKGVRAPGSVSSRSKSCSETQLVDEVMRSCGEATQLVGTGADGDNCRELKHRGGNIKGMAGT